MLFGLRVFITIVMPLFLLFVLGILLLLCGEMWALLNPTPGGSHGAYQPGVGLWSPHFFVLHFFESGLTLNPHNKRHSGLFISLYLCCVVEHKRIYAINNASQI